MAKIPYQAAREEFETLLGRFLWDDLDLYGKKRLVALLNADSSFAEQFRELTSFDDLISSVSPSLSETEPTNLSDFKTKQKSKQKSSLPKFVYGIAATILMISSISIGYLYTRDSYPTDIVTSGACAQDLNYKATPLFHNTSANDFCEIRISQNTLQLKLFPDSSAKVLRNGFSPIASLEKGAVLVNGKKRKKDEEIMILSGFQSITLLGTEILVKQQKEKLSVDVISGTVEVSSANQNILSEATDQQWKKVDPEVFSIDSSIVEEGENATFDRDSRKDLLAKQALQRLSSKTENATQPNSETVQKWKESLTTEEKEALGLQRVQVSRSKLDVDRLEKLKSYSEKNNSSDSQDSIESDPSLKHENPPEQKLDLTQELNFNLTSDERDDEAVARKTERLPTRTIPRQNKRLERKSDQYTVFLKDGTIKKGLAYQEGEDLVIVSQGKTIRIPMQNVERIENK